MKAPMDVPPTMSTGMPHSIRARMMPTWAQPLEHRTECGLAQPLNCLTPTYWVAGNGFYASLVGLDTI